MIFLNFCYFSADRRTGAMGSDLSLAIGSGVRESLEAIYNDFAFVSGLVFPIFMGFLVSGIYKTTLTLK